MAAGAYTYEADLDADKLVNGIADQIVRCRLVDLEHPRRIGDPSHPAHWPGLSLFLHRRHEPMLGEARSSASGVIVAAEHSGTHIDALCHQAENLRLVGEIEVDSGIQGPSGFSVLAMDSVAPILAPGVLLDVAGQRGSPLPEGYLITPQDLEASAAAAGVRVEAGAVVLIRTGYGALWSDHERYLKAAGLSGPGAQWLANRKVRAVGVDNVALDVLGHVDSDLKSSLPCHLVLIARNGIHIIENLDLEELASCGAREFAFVCLPLKIVGGTGCPVRPIALVDGTD